MKKEKTLGIDRLTDTRIIMTKYKAHWLCFGFLLTVTYTQDSKVKISTYVLLSKFLIKQAMSLVS